MELILNHPEWAKGDYVEVMVTDGENTVKVEEGSKFNILSQLDFMKNTWVDKGAERIEKDLRNKKFDEDAQKMDIAKSILQSKYPKKEIYCSFGSMEIWLYHKNGNVMKTFKVDEVI